MAVQPIGIALAGCPWCLSVESGASPVVAALMLMSHDSGGRWQIGRLPYSFCDPKMERLVVVAHYSRIVLSAWHLVHKTDRLDNIGAQVL